MHRALPASRHLASSSGRQVVRVVRRRLATDSTTAPPKKKNILRRIFWTTTASVGTFYVGSTFASFHNQTYFDLFSDNVPLAQSFLDYGLSRGWDTLTVQDVVNAGTGAVMTTYQLVLDTVNGAKPSSESTQAGREAVEKKAVEAKNATFKIIKKTTEKVESVEPAPKKVVDAVKEEAKKIVEPAKLAVKEPAAPASYKMDELVKRAEAAIAGKPYPPHADTPAPEGAVDVSVDSDKKSVYDVPLPLGFEPPPGYVRPSPPKPKAPEPTTATPPVEVTIPLIAPALSTAPEPIIAHLAGTIDDLASYLKSDPNAAAKAGDILETAKTDLSALVDRIEAAKEQERSALEVKLDEQAREYTLKLLELEMEAQDKLDHQQEDFQQLFDQARAKLVQDYRAKLEHELRVQTELINERLKEEVVAQGIELQRRWIREIKVRVEQERGGRLAKLDELSAEIKRLERIALDNSSYLDENIQLHSLWTAVRALSNSAVGSPSRKPFREELRVLRHITAAREDPVISVVLESLEKTDTPDIGVEPLADLASWFVNGVAPKVSEVALVPDENAGVLSYLASKALSSLRFKRVGLVEGNDVLSVLSRAEHYLNEKNLDAATRELNQLKGPAKVLVHDWLQAARRRLEVQQALEVVQTQATLASLLIV